jgi:hypothetical protein
LRIIKAEVEFGPKKKNGEALRLVQRIKDRPATLDREAFDEIAALLAVDSRI